jgi:hypothetical protein
MLSLGEVWIVSHIRRQRLPVTGCGCWVWPRPMRRRRPLDARGDGADWFDAVAADEVVGDRYMQAIFVQLTTSASRKIGGQRTEVAPDGGHRVQPVTRHSSGDHTAGLR